MDADNRVFKLEKATVLNTCGMFGITRMAGRHAVNENGAAIWGYRVVAPRHGFEPRFTAPKAAVLPLDDRGKWGLLCQFSEFIRWRANHLRSDGRPRTFLGRPPRLLDLQDVFFL